MTKGRQCRIGATKSDTADQPDRMTHEVHLMKISEQTKRKGSCHIDQPCSKGKPSKRPAPKIGRAHVELQSRGHLVCRRLLEKKESGQIRKNNCVTSLPIQIVPELCGTVL